MWACGAGAGADIYSTFAGDRNDFELIDNQEYVLLTLSNMLAG